MLIKYMGLSDIRTFPVGETLGGRLAEPLATQVVFASGSGHTVDTAEPPYNHIPGEFWTLLQDAEPFEYVIIEDTENIPSSQWDVTFGQPVINDEYVPTVRTGVGSPDDAIGYDTDWYIDLNARVQYGPKRGGKWGDPSPLRLAEATEAVEAVEVDGATLDLEEGFQADLAEAEAPETGSEGDVAEPKSAPRARKG